jgi:hypothetical protein
VTQRTVKLLLEHEVRMFLPQLTAQAYAKWALFSRHWETWVHSILLGKLVIVSYRIEHWYKQRVASVCGLFSHAEEVH